MLRQALLRDQIRLYAAQSGADLGAGRLVGAVRHLPELYVLAAVSAALKVVVIPLVLGGCCAATGPAGGPVDGRRHRGQRRPGPGRTVLLAIAVTAFGFFAAGRLPVSGSGAPATALSVSVSVVLVAFVLMIHRRDVISQAIGLFSLENGISLAALVVAAEPAADPGGGVAVRPAGRGGGVRPADPGAPRPRRVAVHRRPDQPAGVSHDHRRHRAARRPGWRPRSPASGCRPRCGLITAAAGIASFGLVLALIPAASHHDLVCSASSGSTR